jgi:hypothetical protein
MDDQPERIWAKFGAEWKRVQKAMGWARHGLGSSQQGGVVVGKNIA